MIYYYFLVRTVFRPWLQYVDIILCCFINVGNFTHRKIKRVILLANHHLKSGAPHTVSMQEHYRITCKQTNSETFCATYYRPVGWPPYWREREWRYNIFLLFFTGDRGKL